MSATHLYAAVLLIGIATMAVWLVRRDKDRSRLQKRLHAERAHNSPRAAADAASLIRRTAEADLSKNVLKKTTDFYLSADPETVARIRMQLIRAGFPDPRATGFFFLARGATGITCLIAVFLGFRFLSPETPTTGLIAYSVAVGVLGYFLPNFYLSSRIAKRVEQYREGFPDFMDLMIVCADAGMSMEAAIDRVSREIAVSYPALAENLQVLSIELRAGRPLEDALRSLSERLGLDEARSFAVLLQQSRKLGTSLAQTLRIFSEDMRHKRMSKAEEKAHALPAKMSIPVTMCILPVVMLVATIPVIVRLVTGNFG